MGILKFVIPSISKLFIAVLFGFVHFIFILDFIFEIFDPWAKWHDEFLYIVSVFFVYLVACIIDLFINKKDSQRLQANLNNPSIKNSVRFPVEIYYDNKKRFSYILRKTWFIFLVGFLGQFTALEWFLLGSKVDKENFIIFLINFSFLSLIFLILYIFCVYCFILLKSEKYRFIIFLISMSLAPLFVAIYVEQSDGGGMGFLFILSIIPTIIFNTIIFFVPNHLLNKIDAAKLQQ